MCTLSIVIVNYNTRELLLDCLSSVYKALTPLSAEIWVVDNASSDGSIEAIQTQFPKTKIIANGKNLGFAKANNLALKQAKGDILVLLNPDTKVYLDTFTKLLEAFQGNPKIGIVSPQLQNEDGSIQPSFGQFTSSWTEFFFQFFLFRLFPSPFPLGQKVHPLQNQAYSKAQVIDWASGACLAIRKEIANRVGLLDEAIFLYGEDMEWCYRVKRAGYINWFWPQAKVIHLARQSSKKNYSYWVENYTRGNLDFVGRYRSQNSIRLCGLWVVLGSIIRIFLWVMALLAIPSKHEEKRERISGYCRALQLGWQAFAKGYI